MNSATVQEYRRKTRASWGTGFYSAALHFLCPTVTCFLGIAYSLSLLDQVLWQEWLMVPATFLFGNFLEYFAHRGPMHRRTPGAGLVFSKHTLEHHHFFTEELMSYETTRDFGIVLFPPWAIGLFFGFLAIPVGYLSYKLLSHNAGFLFVATALGYFLNYEWFHLFFHFPDDSWIVRLPLIAPLRRHHARHHNPALMTRYNFNITWPICDWLFGTLR